MIIVDSSVWIDALRGVSNRQTRWLNAAIGKAEIGLTSLILTEVLQGITNPAHFRGFQRDLLQFPIFDTIETNLATSAARNYLLLRSRGITIRTTIDCLIATFCIERGFSLLQNDRDFAPFQEHLGLSIFDPPALPLN
jgi:predicted nucleic acid-binding protein